LLAGSADQDIQGADIVAFDTLAYVKHLEEAGIDRKQAEAHAEAMNQYLRPDLATKDDITTVRGEITALRSEVATDIAALRSDIAALRSDMAQRESRLIGVIAAMLGVLFALLALLRLLT
jgi:hypothetical protein